MNGSSRVPELARRWTRRFLDECPYRLVHLRPWAALNPSDADVIEAELGVRDDETPLVHLRDRGGPGVLLTDRRVLWSSRGARGEAALEALSRVEFEAGWLRKRLRLDDVELRPRSARRADLEVLCGLLRRIMRERDGAPAPREVSAWLRGAGLVAGVVWQLCRVAVAAAIVFAPCIAFGLWTEQRLSIYKEQSERRRAGEAAGRAAAVSSSSTATVETP